MSWASDLIITQEGDVIIIPVVLARAIGLPAAAFLKQAAYFSAIVKKNDGWFFFEQQGIGNPDGKTIFERLGSWQDTLGLGPDAQLTIRKNLKKLGLLQEKNKGFVHGKLQYRVDSENYLNFLVSLSNHATPCNIRHTGNPDCTNGESGLRNPEKSECTNPEIRVDIYKEEAQRKDTTTTAPVTPATAGGGVFDFLIIEPVIFQHQPQLLGVLIGAGITDPDLAQNMLDEVAGTIEAGARHEREQIGNPAKWLKGVIDRGFIGARCFNIQARRKSVTVCAQRIAVSDDLTIDPLAAARGAEILLAAKERVAIRGERP